MFRWSLHRTVQKLFYIEHRQIKTTQQNFSLAKNKEGRKRSRAETCVLFMVPRAVSGENWGHFCLGISPIALFGCLWRAHTDTHTHTHTWRFTHKDFLPRLPILWQSRPETLSTKAFFPSLCPFCCFASLQPVPRVCQILVGFFAPIIHPSPTDAGFLLLLDAFWLFLQRNINLTWFDPYTLPFCSGLINCVAVYAAITQRKMLPFYSRGLQWVISSVYYKCHHLGENLSLNSICQTLYLDRVGRLISQVAIWRRFGYLSQGFLIQMMTLIIYTCNHSL